ncbi:MAG: Ppx/GppA family phosphatase [Armatimonadetes bacterium]|nr:Ppx/GppA family phosphatase [Armatimonadota bacterium]MDE2206836.1 Ppx/GppA family phosphatase [Armatimonadota bacterium]
MANRTVAALDVGTNSVKLLIARITPTALEPLEQRVMVTRLGAGMGATGVLDAAAMERTMAAICQFRMACDQAGVEEVAAVATAAAREAHNGRSFLAAVSAECGVTVTAIPGVEEARLSFLAVRRDPAWAALNGLRMIDVGGGSTEVVAGGRGQEPISRASIPMGAIKLTDNYLRTDPPAPAELQIASAAAAQAMEQASLPAVLSEPVPLIGVGGTLTSLAAIDGPASRGARKIHGHRITVEALDTTIARLSSMRLEERRALKGLDPARAGIIVGGAIMVREAMNWLGCDSLQVSDRGLRWGLLYDRFLPQQD